MKCITSVSVCKANYTASRYCDSLIYQPEKTKTHHKQVGSGQVRVFNVHISEQAVVAQACHGPLLVPLSRTGKKGGRE